MVYIGNNIKKYRELRGWTQVDLANKLNVSKSWMNRVESGKKTPSLRRAFMLAYLLDCRLEDLFFGDELTK